MSSAELAGWIPIRIYWQRDEPMVDWCFLDDDRFSDPFFEQTISRRLLHPFCLLFRQQTPIAVLSDLLTDQASVPPAGFVFHMSRCGSTLVAQMLAACGHTVISEAGPIDTVLRSNLRDRSIHDEQRVAWLRGLIGAYGHLRSSPDERLFVKFDSWSEFELPLLHRAFPETPWVFLYREPVEVLASHVHERGSHTLPGVLEPELLGLERAEISNLSLDEYGARVLAAVCASAVRHHQVGTGRLVNYTELPSVVWTDLCSFFGVADGPEQRDRMREVAGFHGKRPYEPFRPDGRAKRQAASPQLRKIASQWLDPWYEELERLRLDAQTTDANPSRSRPP